MSRLPAAESAGRLFPLRETAVGVVGGQRQRHRRGESRHAVIIEAFKALDDDNRKQLLDEMWTFQRNQP